jgi:hypothetical protein
VRRLYDWGVAADVRGGRRVAPVGVSSQEQQACERMVEALRALPAGITARGWVTAMAYAPSVLVYQRYGLILQAERDASGAVQMIAVDGDA